MGSEHTSRDAIDFLSLVRQDLKDLRTCSDNNSTVVTSRFAEIEMATIESDADETPAYMGRFEVIEMLGEGGFARVFLANDPNLDRDVALKVPKPHVLVSAESRARFEREAKSAAILSHPNIVPVFESGSVGPIHFIASEFCPGPTLRQWFTNLKRKPSPRTVAEIVARLADALQHAHQRGIIHRDLKPANVILVDGDKDLPSRLRITDFGLARQLSGQDSLTAIGAIVGTPAYMSPEQASGTTEIDHRTDVYSLGMILYELLTGISPFKRKNHAASIAAVINEQVPAIRGANPSVDRDLEAICLKAICKEPADRYESAHDLGADLQHWISGESVSARKTSSFGRLHRWVKRNPILASSMLFGVVSLASGFYVSTSQWRQARANLELSIQQQHRAENNAAELHATIVKALEMSVDSLEQNLNVTPVQQKVMDELMQAHKRLIDEEAEVSISTDTFECYGRLARIYRTTGRYAESAAVCDQAENMIEKCAKSEEGIAQFALSAAEIHLQRALLADDIRDQEKREMAFQTSIQFFEKAEPFTDRLTWLEKGFRLHRNHAFSLHDIDSQNCLQAFEMAATFANEAYELAPENESAKYNAAMWYSDMSHVSHSGQGWQARLELLEEAERRFMEIAAIPDSELDCRYRLCYIRNEMARFLRGGVKDYDRAEDYSRMAIEGLQELIAEFPGQLKYTNRLSHAWLRLISIHRDQGKFAEALALMPEARKAHEKGMPHRVDRRIAEGLIAEGEIWADEYNDFAKAETAFDEAITQLESSEEFSLDASHIIDVLLEAYRQKSILYDKKGEREKADVVIGDGWRLSVQRALKLPTDRNIDSAVDRGTYYVKRIGQQGHFGLAKSVLDTLAEAGADSQFAQYETAVAWASLDYMQRELGKEKKDWDASRSKSIACLTKAIDLGFNDLERLKAERFFREYRHLPTFEACCDRVKVQ
ncbi:serine/threonine-protein kinase [Mariniblastus fucicola]|uniref:Serine/threonine-protein kinase PrkC n=1 Tax=Mariniblastus fucicola TaxID=980251 RepID=A0A5B9P8B2_9BACT|nr:serine/threonine-protein kinase [Mariniblastus fucicola]QEG21152.1 Serine/threonine-protein kinase PrkC [Mariniblastus fucicola]